MKLKTKKIKDWCYENNINQYDLSKLMKVSRQTINSWLNNKHTPALFHLQRICKILRLELKDILDD